MNRTAAFIFELGGLILSLVGIFELFVSASEIIYRERPLYGFMLKKSRFSS